MRLRAVVFDFDGVIIDTESTVLASWREEYERHGHELDLVTWLDLVGTETDLWAPYDVLNALVGPGFDRASCHRRRHQREQELVLELSVRAGVLEWLDEAARLGLPTAIASSSPHTWVEPHLARLGLTEAFATVCCREDVASAKPNPDLYLLACARLGVRPAEAVAVEDSPHGVHAAKAAGLFAVAVPNPVTEGQPFGQADIRLASLADATLADLDRRLPHQDPAPDSP